MTKSPRPNVTRNLSHARGPARPGPARCYKNFQARSPARPGVLRPEPGPARRVKARARPGVLRPEPGPSPNGLRARAGLATSIMVSVLHLCVVEGNELVDRPIILPVRLSFL